MYKAILIYSVLLIFLIFSNIVLATEGAVNSPSVKEKDLQDMASPDKPTIKLAVHKIEDKGDHKLVKIKLSSIKDDKPVTLGDLKEVHTQKIHLLIIDSGLKDYTHIHPQASDEPGVYEFLWQPKTQDNYRIWADLVPLTSGKQEVAMADLIKQKTASTKIDKTLYLDSKVDGLNFKLSFDPHQLIAGKPAMGKIIVTDDKGNPVKDLQVLMGTFAHIVGFGEDFKSIIHLHPMGVEPTDRAALGGPEIEFHIEPMKTGFIKLFVQVLIKNKEVYAPFGLMVYKQ